MLHSFWKYVVVWYPTTKQRFTFYSTHMQCMEYFFFLELPITKSKIMLCKVIIMPLGIFCILGSSISFTIIFVLDLLSCT